MASQRERLPNGFPEFGYLCFYCQVFHGNLWDIHMVPASRKSANKISEFFGHQSNYFCNCLFVCFFAWFKTFACLKVGESKRGIFGTKVIMLAVIKNVFFANKDRAKRLLFDN